MARLGQHYYCSDQRLKTGLNESMVRFKLDVSYVFIYSSVTVNN